MNGTAQLFNAPTLDTRCTAVAPGSWQSFIYPDRYERCTLVRDHDGDHLGSKERRWSS